MPAPKEIKDCTEFSGTFKLDTKDAVLFSFDLEHEIKEVWIPYSQVDYLLRGKVVGEKDKIRIKTWIAKKKGLIETEVED